MSARRRMPRLSDKYLVVAGQAAGQIALLAVTPILTRSFTPSELGSYQVAMAIALVIQPLATLRHEWVMPVAKSADTTKRFLRRAVAAIVVTNGALLLIALTLFIFGKTHASASFLMTAFVNLAYSLAAVDNAMLIRAHSLQRLALRNFLSGIAASVLQLLVAVIAPHAILVAAAVLIGRLLAVAATRIGSTTVETVGDGEDSVDYGLKRMVVTIASGIVSSAALQGMTLTTGGTLGSAQAAYTATAQRVAATPAALLGQGIGQAVQASAARSVNSKKQRLSHTVRRAGVRLGVFAALIGAGMIFLGPVLAVPVLGHQWEPVGAILPIIAYPVMLQLVISPLSPVLVMIGNESVILLLNVVRLIASVGAGATAAFYTRDLFTTVTAYSAATTACYILHLAVLVLCIRRYDKRRSKAEESE